MYCVVIISIRNLFYFRTQIRSGSRPYLVPPCMYQLSPVLQWEPQWRLLLPVNPTLSFLQDFQQLMIPMLQDSLQLLIPMLWSVLVTGCRYFNNNTKFPKRQILVMPSPGLNMRLDPG